jgi:hypothetical protein
VSYQFTDATPSNITGGPDKLGVCYGPDDKKGTCAMADGTTVPRMDWTPWPDITRVSPCDLSWDRLNTDGTIDSFMDPHSQQSKAVTYATC